MKNSVSLESETSIGIDRLYFIKITILTRKLHRDKAKQIRNWVDEEFKKLGYSEKDVEKLVRDEMKK